MPRRKPPKVPISQTKQKVSTRRLTYRFGGEQARSRAIERRAGARDITAAEMLTKFPQISPAIIAVAAEGGTVFRQDPALAVGGQYQARENILRFQTGQGIGTLGHEFVHFAQARAPSFLDASVLGPNQFQKSLQANVAMRAITSESPFSLAFSLIPNAFVGTFGPGEIAKATQNQAEFIAHSLAGDRPASPFPTSYFRNLFRGGVVPQELR